MDGTYDQNTESYKDMGWTDTPTGNFEITFSKTKAAIGKGGSIGQNYTTYDNDTITERENAGRGLNIKNFNTYLYFCTLGLRNILIEIDVQNDGRYEVGRVRVSEDFNEFEKVTVFLSKRSYY